MVNNLKETILLFTIRQEAVIGELFTLFIGYHVFLYFWTKRSRVIINKGALVGIATLIS